MARTIDREKQGEWRRRLRRFDTSGLSVAEFCDAEAVSPASFYQWRKRLAAEHVEQDAGRGVRPGGPGFVPVHVTATAAVEIHLPNGARVCLPGGDAEALRIAIEAAGRAQGANVTEAASC